MAIDKVRLVKETPCQGQETLSNFWRREEAASELELHISALESVLAKNSRPYVVTGSKCDDYRCVEDALTGTPIATFRLLYEEMS